MLQICTIVGRKPVQHPNTAVFLHMTDKHANLCLFPCPFSFPLGFACYYNLPCGVDTEKSCFAHIQTIVHYFLKGTVNNFSCVLLFLFMSLFFSPIRIIIAVRFLGFPCLSCSPFVPSLLLLDVAGKWVGV